MQKWLSGDFWSDLISLDLAIDLGTASTLVHAKQLGQVIIYEPSIVAINTATNELEAVGDKAKELMGRTPQGIKTIRPMRDGMIYEVDAAEKMLDAFIRRAKGAYGKFHLSTRICLSVPPRAHQVARRAVRQCCLDARANEVFLVDQTMVAAIGAGLSIGEKRGCMIVDIGGGTTDVAVMSYHGKVFADSILTAGDEMDEAITDYISKKYNVTISEGVAEELKMTLGSAHPLGQTLTMEISGRDMFEGLPKTLVVNDDEIREALAKPVTEIVEIVRKALAATPPQLSADLITRGICLSGGGSLIKGLDERIRKETHLPVFRAENPRYCVVEGTASLLNDIPLLRKIQILD